MASAKNRWAKNDIDYFILDKLKDKTYNLPEADKPTLLRRRFARSIGMPAPKTLHKNTWQNNGPVI